MKRKEGINVRNVMASAKCSAEDLYQPLLCKQKWRGMGTMLNGRILGISGTRVLIYGT